MKSTSRPAFNTVEVAKLLQFMQTWAEQGRLAVEREMRPLLRDYTEMLLLTGMRHGTEAMGLCWKHVEWHTDKSVRYLRIWVNGKTGGRWLIAKHRAVDVLNRLRHRQKSVTHLTLDEVLASPVQSKLFVFSDGYQAPSLNGTFRRLMRDSGMALDANGKNRTLYSLRHTYATQELFAGTDIHTLAKQMGKRSGNPSVISVLNLRISWLINQRTRRGEHGSRTRAAMPGSGGGVPGLWPEEQGVGCGQ
jgi:integrase